MKKVITFGEIMGRLTPDNFLRFKQTMPGKLNLTFAGAEANVAASVAMLGGDATFVTSLPDNDITDACLTTLRGLKVNVDYVNKVNKGRLGLYFVEKGANQRPSRVIYDREYSSVSMIEGSAYDWKKIFEGASWFHFTGITPSLSQIATDAALEAAKEAKAMGLTVSCDLNFRKKLWQWSEGETPTALAKRVMSEILPYVDVVIANEEDASDVLGIEAEGSDVMSGEIDAAKYQGVAEKIVAQFPNVKMVAITLRESISATHNDWSAMLYDATTKLAHFAPLDAEGNYTTYKIKNIVDRVGGGDSFGAGLVFAMNSDNFAEPSVAIRFAVASSCLCHSIDGDFNYVSCDEVASLMGGSASGRVVR
ncbi:MAG: sugar kinase [Rikenellaceae bacterium]